MHMRYVVPSNHVIWSGTLNLDQQAKQQIFMDQISWIMKSADYSSKKREYSINIWYAQHKNLEMIQMVICNIQSKFSDYFILGTLNTKNITLIDASTILAKFMKC